MMAGLHERLRAFLIKVDAHLNSGLLWMASGLLCLMVILVMIQIVARYVLQDAPPWTEEGARYCMVWSALLAATCAFYEGADPALVKIDADSPPRLQRAVSLARFACVLAFSGTLLVYSPGMIVRSSLRQSEALGMNLSLVTAVVPVFALVILFHAIVQFVTGRAAERRVI